MIAASMVVHRSCGFKEVYDMTARVATMRDASPELTGTVVGSERIEAGGMIPR